MTKCFYYISVCFLVFIAVFTYTHKVRASSVWLGQDFDDGSGYGSQIQSNTGINFTDLNSFSTGFWFKHTTSSIATYETILHYIGRYNYRLSLYTTKIEFERAGACGGTQYIDDNFNMDGLANIWTYYGIVWNATNSDLKLYIATSSNMLSEVIHETGVASDTAVCPNYNFNYGQDDNGMNPIGSGGHVTNGKYAYGFMIPRALSQSDLESIKNTGSVPNGVIFDIPMQESSGTTLYNQDKNLWNNNFTVYRGFLWTSTDTPPITLNPQISVTYLSIFNSFINYRPWYFSFSNRATSSSDRLIVQFWNHSDNILRGDSFTLSSCADTLLGLNCIGLNDLGVNQVGSWSVRALWYSSDGTFITQSSITNFDVSLATSSVSLPASTTIQILNGTPFSSNSVSCLNAQGTVYLLEGTECPAGLTKQGDVMNASTTEKIFSLLENNCNNIESGFWRGFCNAARYVIMPSTTSVQTFLNNAGGLKSMFPFSLFFNLKQTADEAIASVGSTGTALSLNYSIASNSMSAIVLSSTTLSNVTKGNYSTLYKIIQNGIWIIAGLAMIGIAF